MFYDDKMDISAYILIKLIGTACAWKEDKWQYNILFCILTVCKHDTDSRIQEFSSGGGGGWRVQVSLTKKLWQRFFLVLSLFGQFQRNLSFFKAPDGVQFFPGGPTFSGGCPIAYSL